MMRRLNSNLSVMTLRSLHPVGKYFIAIFLIVIVEGAVRKWIWAGATIPLLALRDSVVIVAVLWGVFHRHFDVRGAGEIILIFWTAIVFIWTSIQILIGLQPLVVGGIGFRFWVLYLWFVLLCVKTLSWQDVEYLFKIFALTLLFMVPLALVQFMSPPTSFINRQAGGEDQLIFTVVKDIVRTTGTFSFTAGYTTYLSFVTPVALWLMTGGLKDCFNPIFRLLIVGLFFAGVLVSGSRGAIMTTAFFTGAWFFSLLLANRLPKLSPAKVLVGSIGVFILLLLLYPILERSYEANAQRFENASASENVGQRIIGMYTGNEETWDRFAIFGYGIGAGANASRTFMPPTHNGFLLGENEIDRVLNEGGLVGLMLATLKWLVIIIGLLSAWNIFKRNGEFLPLSIWLVISVQLPTNSVIGQLSIHGFILLLLGLGFASLSCWHSEKCRRQGLKK